MLSLLKITIVYGRLIKEAITSILYLLNFEQTRNFFKQQVDPMKLH